MEHIVKATEQLAVGFQHVLRKDAEHLLRQVILGNVEVIIQSGKRRPADVQGGKNVGLCPLHNVADLVPIVHILEFQMLHRRTGDDAAVIILIPDLRKSSVECGEMVLGCVLADMAGDVQKFHTHL